MTDYIKRSAHRESCTIPIIWTDYHSGSYRNATVCNTSEGGLYFKTQFRTKSKSDIFIKPVHYQPNTIGPEGFKFYEAKVKWQRELPSFDGNHFGIGVQYLAKSHEIYEPTYQCSMCDMTLSYGDIHEIDDFVYLCPHCIEKFNRMPDGRLKSNLKNFLMGNVI